jgi:hypothetical protein
MARVDPVSIEPFDQTTNGYAGTNNKGNVRNSNELYIEDDKNSAELLG